MTERGLDGETGDRPAMRMISYDDRSLPFIEVFRRSATRAGYAVELIGPSAAVPDGFARLERAYRHLSPNNPHFELSSFRRWFEIAERVDPDERFVHADADLIVCTPWAELPGAITGATGLVASIAVNDGIAEKQINAGFSLWTGSMLADFCEFAASFYESRADELARIHAGLLESNPRASISDMTLMYLWVQERAIPFYNTNSVLRDEQGRLHYVDHNINLTEAINARFKTSYGRKAVWFTPRGINFRTADGEPVIADSVHMAGRMKILSEPFEKQDKVQIALKSTYILLGRLGRRMAASLGVHI